MDNTFAGLATEQKKEKIVFMLQELQNTHPIFANLYTLVSKIKKLSDEVLDFIYDTIMRISDQITSLTTEQIQNSFQNIQNNLQSIYAQEQAARADEQPDSLLEDL